MHLEIVDSKEERERKAEMLAVMKELRDCVCRLATATEGILEELKLHRLPAVKGIVRLGKPIDQ